MTRLPVHRIRLVLHYDGSDFFGWQLQPRERTVQGELERVVSRLFDSPARVVGSGRTDRGVHATGQVAVVDAPVTWTSEALRRSMNALLPPDVWVAEAHLAPPAFHPRFAAIARSYEYRLGLVPDADSPFLARWCWPLGDQVDLVAMQSAAADIVGEHSFRPFAKAGQEHLGERCIVGSARFEPWEPVGIRFCVTANRFLHHMVRYLVGTLVAIGLHERAGLELRAMLEGDTSLTTSPPAPPEGLFLTRVEYASGAYDVHPST